METPNPQKEPDEFCLVSVMFPLVSDDQLAIIRTHVKTLSDAIGNCRYEIKLTGKKDDGRGLVNQNTSPSST